MTHLLLSPSMAKVAAKAKTTGKKVAKPKKVAPIPEVNNNIPSLSMVESLMTRLPHFTKKQPPKVVYIAVALIGLALLFSYKKSWFIAASVNNNPISNFNVLSRLNDQYRSKMLEQMINESLVLSEAQKKGVSVSDTDIKNKISQIEANYGGAQVLDGLLAQQGQTREGLKDQIKFQLIIEKLYGNEATVSAEEVTSFVDQNKDSLQATDSAGQEKEATDILKQQKLSKVFQEKFQQLKAAAKIQIF